MPMRLRDAFKSLASALGTVDILVNNAGFSEHPTFSRTDPAGWRHDVNGNLNGAYYCAHAVIPGMKEKGAGSIIAIGSVNGLSALGDPAYSASKAGMMSLTRSLAVEYGRFGIRANIVLPGTVRTPLWERKAGKDSNVLESLKRWYPLGPDRRSHRRGAGRGLSRLGCGGGHHGYRATRRLWPFRGQYRHGARVDAREFLEDRG